MPRIGNSPSGRNYFVW